MRMGVRGYCDPEAAPEPDMAVDRQAAGEMGRDLVDCWQLAQRVLAEFSDRLRNFDLAHAYAADGALSAPAWLRSHCQMTYAQAAQQLMVARRLDQLQETASAFAAGEISYQHTAVIASCARKLGNEVVAKHEKVLVECARQVDAYSLGRVTRHLEEIEDPDGSLGFFEQQHDRRRVELGRMSDGMWSLRGILDSEGGAVLATRLEALMGPPAPDDDRAVWQRRADALVEAVQAGAESPQLTVITELPTLRGQRPAPGGELREQAVVPGAVVRRIACDCSVEHGHVCADGIQVDLTDRTRVIAPKLRRQLELRDGGCRFPGCDRPPAWTDGHHLVHWADGGPTELANLVLLCRRHHRKAHEGGWSLGWGDGGELVALPP